MIIKEKDLLNYIDCPMKYNLAKYGTDINNITYNTLLHDMFNYICNVFYNSSNNNSKPSHKTIQNKWDTICRNNQDKISPKQVVEGLGLINRTYEYMILNKIKFVDTCYSYTIEIEECPYILTGQLYPFIERIERDDNTIEIIIPSYSKTKSDRYYIDTKIKHTIDAYALTDLYKDKKVIFTYHSFLYNTDMYTTRNYKDFNKLETIIKNVGHSIKNNLLYPRVNYSCNTCLGKGLCDAWDGEPNHNAFGRLD